MRDDEYDRSATSLLTVDNIHHTLFLEIARLQNVTCRKIVLLCCTKVIVFWIDGKVTTLVFVQYATEN